LVLDVEGNRDEEHRKVRIAKRNNGKNQQWKIIYIDSISKETLKKEQSGVVEGFGFHANRPFYIRSRLPL
jgi:hypothetical protein